MTKLERDIVARPGFYFIIGMITGIVASVIAALIVIAVYTATGQKVLL